MYDVLDENGSGTIDCAEMMTSIDTLLREVYVYQLQTEPNLVLQVWQI